MKRKKNHIPSSINEKSLEHVAVDLFKIFETEEVTNRPERVNEYFRQEMMKAEIGAEVISNDHISLLESAVKSYLLPAYDVYDAKKQEVERKSQSRKAMPIIAGTVIGLNILELAVFRGMLHRHLLFLGVGAVFEIYVGWLLYTYAWPSMDNKKIGNAASKYFTTAKNLAKKIQTEDRHRALQEIMDGELLEAEAYKLLSQYERPDDFWADYKKVRSVDPINQEAFKLTNAPKFETFLELHLIDQYGPGKREGRFNSLLIKANQYFLAKDRGGYVMKELAKRRN